MNQETFLDRKLRKSVQSLAGMFGADTNTKNSEVIDFLPRSAAHLVQTTSPEILATAAIGDIAAGGDGVGLPVAVHIANSFKDELRKVIGPHTETVVKSDRKASTDLPR